MSTSQHTRHTAFRNAPITASVRPELRAVFVSGPDGLTMHWIATGRETRIHNPNEGKHERATAGCAPVPVAG